MLGYQAILANGGGLNGRIRQRDIRWGRVLNDVGNPWLFEFIPHFAHTFRRIVRYSFSTSLLG
jgi:hypothetical protein